MFKWYKDLKEKRKLKREVKALCQQLNQLQVEYHSNNEDTVDNFKRRWHLEREIHSAAWNLTYRVWHLENWREYNALIISKHGQEAMHKDARDLTRDIISSKSKIICV